jgi:hypothetical protein
VQISIAPLAFGNFALALAHRDTRDQLSWLGFDTSAFVGISALEPFMTSITVVVRRREPDGTSTPVSAQQLHLVGATEKNAAKQSMLAAERHALAVYTRNRKEEEPTLAERVFLFLDQRTA